MSQPFEISTAMTINNSETRINDAFVNYGLPGDMQIGSNTAGSHPASVERPVQHPEWDRPSERGYVVSKTMINEPPPERPMKIIMMGAGAAGIDFLHFAPTALQGLGVEIICYDKNPEIGGTWYENRYELLLFDYYSIEVLR